MGIFEFGIKKKVEGIIFEAELTALRSGVDRIEVLKAYAREIKSERLREEITKIVRKLEKGERYSKVYEPYLSPDVVKLIEIAESKGLPIAKMIEEYVPVKKTVENLESSLKAGLKVPLVTFALVSLVFSFVLSQFKQISQSLELSFYSTFLMDYYAWVMLVIGVVFGVVLWKYPNKVPFFKKVYDELKAIIGLSLSKTAYQMGLSSADLVPMLKSYYQAQGKYSLDISGVIKLLYPYLSELDKAQILIAVKYGKIEEKLSELANEKFKNVENLRKVINDGVDNLTKVLIAIPIFPPLVVYLDILSKVTSNIK